ncbi:hypothetical protein N7481_012738 [Penicillium waksmanii]|uniref:uncharacterized protein n=1 Tax=Penicillium waksmanii TaxID=69791 RepID=UPI0025483028|nr:uncharacterized protein N7481_012738 [Penicillium waksmanii]KAJ5966024.1 hypothetical protein N7481_012738 [Penicillium waksmanii]
MDALPITDLSTKQDPATVATLRHALRKYGAFRLWAPELKQAVAGGLLREARDFFQLPNEIKQRTKGYSGFGTELIRGTTPIPKEGINFFRKNDQRDGCIPPPAELFRSVIAIHDNWKRSQDQLFNLVFCDVLESDIPLTGTPTLDYESVGIQYYSPQRMITRGGDYAPPHMDGGTLTILIREDDDSDGLEVADLESTEELGSDGVGREADFLRVPAAPNEVVVLAGTRLQRILGRTKARACVHRVVGPGQKPSTKDRVSVGIFRASAPPPPPPLPA